MAAITIPSTIIRSLKAAQDAGRKSNDRAKYQIFLAARATGASYRALHAALKSAGITDYSASMVGNVIRATADLPSNASADDVVAAVKSQQDAYDAAKRAKREEAAESGEGEGEGEGRDTADSPESLVTTLRAAAAMIRAVVSVRDTADAVAILATTYKDQELAETIVSALKASNTRKAHRAA